MIGPKYLYADRQRLLERRLGVCVAAFDVIECCQIVEKPGDSGVIRPERFLCDHQRSCVKRLGIGVAALGLVENGQTV